MNTTANDLVNEVSPELCKAMEQLEEINFTVGHINRGKLSIKHNELLGRAMSAVAAAEAQLENAHRLVCQLRLSS